MTTTAIFAELLIGGFQAAAWILFLVWARTGYGLTALIQDAKDLEKWSTFIALLAVAACYGLGILIDRIADSLFGSFDKRLRKRWYRGAVKVPVARLTVAHESESMAKFLDYVRSRMRLARSATFNALVALLSVVAVSFWKPEVRSHLAELATAGVVILGVTAFVWVRISETYYKRLAQAHAIVTTPLAAPPAAAATPARRGGGGALLPMLVVAGVWVAALFRGGRR